MSYADSNTSTSKIILQILFFGGIWLFIPLILSDLDFNGYNFMRGIKIMLGVSTIILLNIKWLLPKFFFQNKTGVYILASIGLLMILYFFLETLLAPYLDTFRPNLPKRPRRGPGNIAFDFIRSVNILMPYVLAFVGSALFEISSFANKKKVTTQVLNSNNPL